MTDDTLFTVPPVLTPRQQLVYDLTEHGPLNADQAGIAWHIKKGGCKCSALNMCDYADSTGREILESLRKKGLLKRDVHWVYRRAGETGGLQGDLPEGF